MQEIGHIYIDGRFVEPHGTERFDLHNPATGEVFGRVRLGNVEDARAAIAAAKRAFPSWSRSTKAERIALLYRLYDTVLAPSGLKTTQRAILAEIGRSEPTMVGAAADALVMDAGGLAHTLKPLTREKLVTIAVDPQNRRNRLISLTPLGRSKLHKSDALWEAAQRSFEAAFGATESEDCA
jgi:DNA-binding MarR family transcriptional regulator